MALTREVILKYTIDGEGAKKGAAQIDKSLDKTKKSASGFSKAISAIGPQLIAAFSVGAIVNFGKQAVKTFAEFEKSLASLQGILGVTTKELKFFKDAALELAVESTRSANEIVKAFELVGSAKPELLANSAALKEVTERVLILSEASGLDLVQATDALTGSLNQFSAGAEEADRFLNALAAGAQAGSSAIPELSQTIKVAGTIAADAGLSFEELVGITETLGERSIKGAEAGTALRNVLLNLQIEGVGFKSGVFDINDALEELAGKTLSTQEATKLFGREAISAGNILVANRERFKDLTAAVTGTNTAYEQAAINNATFEASSKRLSNAIDVLFIQLGERIAPAIQDLAELLTDLTGNLDAVIEEIDGFAKIGKQVFSVIGPIIDFIRGLTESIESVTGSFAGFSQVLNLMSLPFIALKKNIEVTADFFTGIGQVVDVVTGKFGVHEDQVDDVGDAYSETTAKFGLWNDEFEDSEQNIENWRSGMLDGLKAAFKLINATEDLTKKQKKLNDETVAIAGSLDFYREKISAIAEALNSQTIPGTEEYIEKQKELKTATDELNDALIRARGPILTPDAIQGLETGSGLMADIADNSERVGVEAPEAFDKATDAAKRLAGVSDIIIQSLTIASQVVEILDLAFEASFQRQLGRLQKERDERIDAAGESASAIQAINEEFDKRQEEIEKKQFQRSKALAISSAVINTALGITRTIADVPKVDFGIATAILIALYAALGAAQVAVIASKQFAAGEINIDGPGTGTSDSISARISKGESVITAQKTRQFLPTLEAIHTGRISPDLLNTFVNSAGKITINNSSDFKDTGIIDATNRQTKDLIRALNRNSNIRESGRYSNRKRLING